MLTSSSPETPVASWSSLRSRIAPMFCGARVRTSETVSIWVPTPQPTTASTRPTLSTATRRAIAKSSSAPPIRAARVELLNPCVEKLDTAQAEARRSLR